LGSAIDASDTPLGHQMASVVCMIAWFKPCSAASAGHSLHSVGFDAQLRLNGNSTL
jgi:hypothetical protein